VYIGCVNTVVKVCSSNCKIVIAYVHVGLKRLPDKYLLNIFTTDCQRHTAEMAVVETLWQLHTLTVINSCVIIIIITACPHQK